MASMRHNRKRKRGRRRFGLLFKLLCGAALVAAATLGATVFFQVETIAVVGNSRYTAQEVIDASGVQIGDNLFQMNKNQISQQILQRLPYVGEVSPQRGLPSTLTIQVTEISAAAQVEVYQDDSAQAEPAAEDGSGDSGEAEDAGEDPEAQDDEAIEEDEDGYEGEEDEDDEGEDDDEDEDEEDDEEDEDDEDDDDEDDDEEEEGEPLTREDLEEMTDDELKELLDYIEMEYSSDPFDREGAIEAILEYQEYQNEPENE